MDYPDKLDQPMSKQWHYHPKLPVGFYPFFEWPPQPKNWLNFIWNYWLQKSDRTIFLVLAFFTFYFLMPPMEIMATLAPGWVLMVILRDLILFIIVTGGLHWWFYIRECQGKNLNTIHRSERKKISYFLLITTFTIICFGLL